ncbi:hypothetical protein RHEC894_CH00129 [Rhizobium sp. CIAT894]|nr:hypothetical protein RHEC894_CH00129 [Rhizobium sp. CIAT894]
MCIKHDLSFSAGARAIADIKAQRTVDRKQCDVSRARQREAFISASPGNPVPGKLGQSSDKPWPKASGNPAP